MDLRISIDSLTDWWKNNNEKVGNCESFFSLFLDFNENSIEL